MCSIQLLCVIKLWRVDVKAFVVTLSRAGYFEVFDKIDQRLETGINLVMATLISKTQNVE